MKKTMIVNISWDIWLKIASICAEKGITYTSFIASAIKEKIERLENELS